MHGMKDYFRDKLSNIETAIGSFDDSKNLYNITFTNEVNRGNNDTISFSEGVRGWTSRKSFIPESALSLNNVYYTFSSGNLYSHDNQVRNTFYGGSLVPSSINVILNDFPGTIKSFKTLNYEGTQGQIIKETNDTDGSLYNLADKKGWSVSSITTNLQTGFIKEFIEKESKWFNYIKGDATNLTNLDTKEFSVQGIGVVNTVTGDVQPSVEITIKENND